MSAGAHAVSVSVIIPTYNGSAFIDDALESVFRQTLLPGEIIVVDDASMDGTPDCVESIARHAPVPIRVLRLTRNSGSPARPFNIGVRGARGELIAGLDQDDVFLPTKLEEQTRPFQTRDDLAFTFGLCARLDRSERLLQEAEVVAQLGNDAQRFSEYLVAEGPKVLRLLVERGCFVVGYAGFVFRRSLWSQRGGVDEKLSIASDYDFLCWLSTQGPVGVTPRVHYLRREHDANMCRRRLEALCQVAQVRCRYLRGHALLRDDSRLQARIRADVFGLAYWAREAHEYRRAARLAMLAGRCCGWDRPCLGFLGKLVVHRVWAAMGRHRARDSAFVRAK